MLTDERARRGAGGDRRLRRPEVAVHARPLARASPSCADAAARDRGLPDGDAVLVRRAGLVHDLGRLGVSNAIWDKPGALTAAERERVRLHPYLTERMLASSPALAPLGAVAVQHHERLDGSGYPRGLQRRRADPGGPHPGRGRRVPGQARAAAAPAARSRPSEAAAYLRAEVTGGPARRRRGRRGARARPGHPVRRRRAWPAGLTPARSRCCGCSRAGCRNREIADRLVHLAQDGRQPRRAHLREDRRLQPGPGEPVRRAERVDATGRRGLAGDPVPKMRWLAHDRRSLRPYRRMCRIDRRGSDEGGSR